MSATKTFMLSLVNAIYGGQKQSDDEIVQAITLTYPKMKDETWLRQQIKLIRTFPEAFKKYVNR